MAGFNYNEQVWQRLYDWQSLTYLLLGTLEKSWWFSLDSIAESQEQRRMGADSLWGRPPLNKNVRNKRLWLRHCNLEVYLLQQLAEPSQKAEKAQIGKEISALLVAINNSNMN